jgi:hypothetical protein
MAAAMAAGAPPAAAGGAAPSIFHRAYIHATTYIPMAVDRIKAYFTSKPTDLIKLQIDSLANSSDFAKTVYVPSDTSRISPPGTLIQLANSKDAYPQEKYLAEFLAKADVQYGGEQHIAAANLAIVYAQYRAAVSQLSAAEAALLNPASGRNVTALGKLKSKMRVFDRGLVAAYGVYIISAIKADQVRDFINTFINLPRNKILLGLPGYGPALVRASSLHTAGGKVVTMMSVPELTNIQGIIAVSINDDPPESVSTLLAALGAIIGEIQPTGAIPVINVNNEEIRRRSREFMLAEAGSAGYEISIDQEFAAKTAEFQERMAANAAREMPMGPRPNPWASNGGVGAAAAATPSALNRFGAAAAFGRVAAAPVTLTDYLNTIKSYTGAVRSVGGEFLDRKLLPAGEAGLTIARRAFEAAAPIAGAVVESAASSRESGWRGVAPGGMGAGAGGAGGAGAGGGYPPYVDVVGGKRVTSGPHAGKFIPNDILPAAVEGYLASLPSQAASAGGLNVAAAAPAPASAVGGLVAGLAPRNNGGMIGLGSTGSSSSSSSSAAGGFSLVPEYNEEKKVPISVTPILLEQSRSGRKTGPKILPSVTITYSDGSTVSVRADSRTAIEARAQIAAAKKKGGYRRTRRRSHTHKRKHRAHRVKASRRARRSSRKAGRR